MHALTLRIALAQLKQRLFARIVTVGSVAAVLIACGSLGVFLQGLSGALAKIERADSLTAYLRPTVAANDEERVVQEVRAQFHGKGDVDQVQLVSRDAVVSAVKKYFPDLGGQLEGVDREVVPRYIKVKADQASIASVESALKRNPAIESVERTGQRFEGLVKSLGVLRTIAYALLAGLSLALLCVFLNHFKLGGAHHSQVRAAMQALGAGAGQAVIPFLIEGLVEGAAAGILAAVGFLAASTMLAAGMSSVFQTLGYGSVSIQAAPIAIAMVATGLLSGTIGSLWAGMQLQRK